MTARFLEWARAALAPLATVEQQPPWSDLTPLREAIGEATMVALGEGAHATAEPLELRNRLFQDLVEKKGFTAIAIESGLIESRLIHDYVRGGNGQLDSVLEQGLSWAFDCLPQNRALVRWLREYNADTSRARKINFYGFDGSGFVSRTRPYFGHDVPLGEALRFLSRVDGNAAGIFRGRFGPFMQSMRFHPRRFLEGPCYSRLGQPERDAITAAIADLVVWLERHEGKYVAASTHEEYAWGHCAALAVRQMDNYLRQYPVGWMLAIPQAASDDELPAFAFDAMNVRDRAQADNVEWIARNEGPAGKVLLFAARAHLSTAPAKVSWHPHRHEHEQQPAGTYLRRRFGRQLLTIGNLIGQGECGCGDYGHTLGKASSQSLDGLAGDVGAPLFLLDLRRAPPEVTNWLDQGQELASGSQRMKVPVARAFDVLLYIDTVRRADA